VRDVTITATDSGPYLVQGTVTLLDPDGHHYEAGDTIALCRCGHSATKPFCDGAHQPSNFTALDRATALAQ
jgi:CDGSH-type Zn-finger protein